MARYLELHYISPHTAYKFDKKANYLLVIVGTDNYNSRAVVGKVYIKNIGNIDAQIRAFSINQSFAYGEVTDLTVMLFKLDKSSNMINLLFTGKVDLSKQEFYGIQYMVLNKPPAAGNLLRHAKYEGDRTFLSEQFYRFERKESTKSFCILFFAKVHQTKFSIVPRTTVAYDSMQGDIYLYDRYNGTVVRELVPIHPKPTGLLFNKHYKHLQQFVNSYCFAKAYDKYVRDYQIDTTVYSKDKTTKNPFVKRIPLQLRPKSYEPYLNNMLLAAVDSRVRAFRINKSTKFNLYNRNYNLDDFTQKPYELHGGSGYLSRMNPQDYQRAYTPYSGYLSEVGVYNKGARMIVLKYESDYFMPPTVHERDYAAVIYGNFIHTGVGVGAGNRAYPELLEVQPDTHLVYYVVLMGSIELTNGKLKNLTKVLDPNTTHRIKPMWIEQGEELGYFGCADGTVVVMTNRPIEFTADISHYSKLSLNSLQKPLDTYVKTRDIIGLLM